MSIENFPRDERGHIHVPVADKNLIAPPYKIVGTAGAGQTLEFLIRKIDENARLGQETGVTGNDIVSVPDDDANKAGHQRPA